MNYFDKYMTQHSLDLYEKIKGKKTIYLDLKYWILLRDRDKTKDPVKVQVVELNANRCVFPISDTTFWEIMKQAEDTRKLTFEVVDKFSQCLTIVNGTARLRAEFYYWIQKHKITGLTEPFKLIWTNINLEIGRKFYADKANLINETMQKQLLDTTCRFSISDIFSLNNQSFPFQRLRFQINLFKCLFSGKGFHNPTRSNYTSEAKCQSSEDVGISIQYCGSHSN